MTTIETTVGGNITANIVTATSFSGSGADITNISLASLGTLTANSVVVTDNSGTLIASGTLSTSRGGTGQDLSGIGAGPFIITASSGTVAATLRYSQNADANTIALRDGSGNVAMNSISLDTLNTQAIQSNANLSITSLGGGFLNLGVVPIQQVGSVSGAIARRYIGNAQTVGATTAPIITLATVANTSYGVFVFSSYTQQGGTSSGMQKFYQKVKNVSNVLTVSTLAENTRIRDTPLNGADTTVTASGTNIVVNAIGIAATTINWTVQIDVVQHVF
jgi:hypothetical protein